MAKERSRALLPGAGRRDQLWESGSSPKTANEPRTSARAVPRILQTQYKTSRTPEPNPHQERSWDRFYRPDHHPHRPRRALGDMLRASFQVGADRRSTAAEIGTGLVSRSAGSAVKSVSQRTLDTPRPTRSRGPYISLPSGDEHPGDRCVYSFSRRGSDADADRADVVWTWRSRPFRTESPAGPDRYGAGRSWSYRQSCTCY